MRRPVGAAGGYAVRYVPDTARLRGGAQLQVVVTAPPVPTDAWFRPDGTLLDTREHRTFRELAWGGGGPDRSQFDLGVRARLPFRVTTLTGPGAGSRVVVDVAHRW